MAYLIIKEAGAERTIPVADEEITIGRSRQNPIRLETEQASRKHCSIVRAEKGHKVVDAQSSNGTFVNGLKVDEKLLCDGDLISIGQATIMYRDGEIPIAVPAPGPESATAPIAIQDRSVRILLNTIVKAAAATDIDAFLEDAVDNVLDIVDAQRGILFASDESGELKPRVARDGRGRALEDLASISRSIPKQVFETGKAIYLLDTEQGREAIQSKSVSIYHLRTVMCAPMRVGEKRLGALYVDSQAKSREYSAVDLALFEAVTNYIALTEENVRAQAEAKRRQEEKSRALERENAVLRMALERRRHIIGECAPMKAVYDTIRKVAPTDVTVLILGESGTGKEAMAHVCHDLSPRSGAPFVVIDCAAIPETLLESELFGYEKGAFTGAAGTKPGKFELAQGGTIFLDEIGELSPALQVKLLRALEQKTVMRVGGAEPIRCDARLIAATNRNLEEMVSRGQFRQDLYFRLKVVTVTLPPLRERGQDVALLAQHFLEESNAANNRAVRGFSDEAKAALLRHTWDGNVRELKHRIEQAVILTDREFLSTEDLELAAESVYLKSLEAARDAFEKSYIVKSLARNEFNVTHTAKALGISRQHLQNLIKKYGIAKCAE